MMYLRVVKEGNVDPVSLETMGLDFLLDMTEYLDIQNFIESDIHKQMEKKRK